MSLELESTFTSFPFLFVVTDLGNKKERSRHSGQTRSARHLDIFITTLALTAKILDIFADRRLQSGKAKTANPLWFWGFCGAATFSCGHLNFLHNYDLIPNQNFDVKDEVMTFGKK